MRMQHRSERGAVFIYVAIGLLVLIAFSAFVVDYGMMWVSRGQAQHAADAGALAGAVSLAFDMSDDRPATATASATSVAQSNAVFGQAPGVQVQTPYSGVPPCATAGDSCVRVDTYRDGQFSSNPLPTWFANLININEQGVRAMAVARATFGDSSTCLKPWAIPDKWLDDVDTNAPVDSTWTPDDEYEPGDTYVASTESDPGTGFTVEEDWGTQVVLKAGSPHDAIAPGQFYPIAIGGTGGAVYRDNIAGCSGILLGRGTEVDVEPGNMIGPTKQGVDDLIALDPDAVWNPTGGPDGRGGVEGGCSNPSSGEPTCARSPRIVPVPVFDTAEYYANKMTGRHVIRIANILGFFIERMQGNDVVGRITTTPGLTTGSGTIAPSATFSYSIQLVR